MKTLKMKRFAGGVLLSLALVVGCTPDEMTVTIPATTVKKVQSGEVAFVKVSAKFTAAQDNKDGSLTKIKNAALPYLGEGATIDFKEGEVGAEFSANFRIPFHKKSVPAPASVLQLVMSDDGTAKLVKGPSLAKLNKKFESDGLMGVDVALNGGHTKFQIMNNTESPTKIHVIGAFVNRKAVASAPHEIPEAETSVIDFSRDAGSVWNSLDPFVIFK